jgi:hypothetical protein
MNLHILEGKEFASIFDKHAHVYNTFSFTEINRGKVDQVYYLAFKDTKFRLGLIIGIKNKVALSPFSSPFGGFVSISRELGIGFFDLALDCLLEWFQFNNIKKYELTLPPFLYGESFISKQLNSLFRKGFVLKKTDLIHYLDLISLKTNYLENLQSNSRRNLKIAKKSNLSFFECIEFNDIRMAFEIIELNRKERGYPLRMNFEQITQTMKVVKSKIFAIKDINGEMISSAFVFEPQPFIAQVIYWGALSSSNELRPMNLLAFNIFELYEKRDFQILDIGTSTEDSLPNFGLCEFKESIGCKSGIKLNLEFLIS